MDRFKSGKVTMRRQRNWWMITLTAHPTAWCF